MGKFSSRKKARRKEITVDYVTIIMPELLASELAFTIAHHKDDFSRVNVIIDILSEEFEDMIPAVFQVPIKDAFHEFRHLAADEDGDRFIHGGLNKWRTR